jgi:hypothetical protein
MIETTMCSLARSINLQGKIGALYSIDRIKNSITAFGEMTAWAREVL